MPRNRVLLMGFGNPGRQDDGLGPALAAAIEQRGLEGVTADANYQLSVEDASAVAEHDVVIFADAATCGREPFAFYPLEPADTISFSTHSVSPGAVLGLAQELFSAEPPAYMLAIRGYEFNEYRESLSAQAKANLDAAVRFIEQVIRQGDFASALTDTHQPAPRASDTCQEVGS